MQSQPGNQADTKSPDCIGTATTSGQSVKSSNLPSVTDVKGLLQVTEVELRSPDKSENIFALCDSACSHS